jgi:hypothetical protein
MDDTQLQTCLDVIDGNKPLGDWQDKPAVPATTVAATNNSGFAMWVVPNGTYTAVHIDGVLISNLTSGWFRVRNGSTISLTYSSTAPTWQWFYE